MEGASDLSPRPEAAGRTLRRRSSHSPKNLNRRPGSGAQWLSDFESLVSNQNLLQARRATAMHSS